LTLFNFIAQDTITALQLPVEIMKAMLEIR